jgi:hypothetical protein
MFDAPEGVHMGGLCWATHIQAYQTKVFYTSGTKHGHRQGSVLGNYARYIILTTRCEVAEY